MNDVMSRRRKRLRRLRQSQRKEEKEEEEEGEEDVKRRNIVTRQDEIFKSLSDFFLRQLRRGIVSSQEELRSKAREKGLVLSRLEAEKFLQRWPEIVQFRELRTVRPPSFQSIFRTGMLTYFVDVCFLPFPRKNKGHTGFIVAVECFSRRLAVAPMKRKTEEAFIEAFETMLGETMEDVSVVISDREPALMGKKCQSRLARHGIRVRFFTRRSKSYLAERIISYLKSLLSRCMAATKSKSWLPLLRPAVQHYNRQKIRGTSFRRNEVNRKTIHRFIEEKMDIPDFRSLLNSSKINAESIKNKDWLKKLFKFEKGERVLVSKRFLGERKTFDKPSLLGYFSKTKYVVTDRYLATSKKLLAVPGGNI